MAADPISQQRKLQILCLHGSRQDGEVFSQRLKTLQKKLKSIADLHFISAPHTLPLQEGQSIPMRAWWRHWHVATADDLAQQQQQQLHSQSSQSSLQTSQSMLHGKEREDEVHAMMAAGWEAVVVRDWSVSLRQICNIWHVGPPHLAAAVAGSSSSSSIASGSSSSSMHQNNVTGVEFMDATSSSGTSQLNGSSSSNAADNTAAAASVAGSPALEYDGVLGFSNGAAAAFLFAAHAAAHPERFRSLQFVALAGGYVPEPLDKLVPGQILKPQPPGSGSSSSSSSDAPPPAAARLNMKLPFASLHMMGSNDPLMDVADSSLLMDCFQEHGRVQLIHNSGHSVPQQSKHMQDILHFIVQFAEIQLPTKHRHHRPHKHPAAAATAAALQKAPSLKRPLHKLPSQRLQEGVAAAAAVSPVAAAAADIESQLHRQGLRDKTTKGPHKHHTLIKLDATGQPHQHVDMLITNPKHHNKQQQQQPTQNAQQQQEDVTAAAAAAVEFGAASEIQLEELEALQAIFASEFHCISQCPPTFTVKLREPDLAGDDEQQQQGDSAAAAAAGPPSRLFSLKFKLPKEYPSSETALPVVEIEGPLGTHDPARAALHQHIMAAAAQQQQDMAGSGGYIWQITTAAKDWIDDNIPADIASRKAGQHIDITAPHSSTGNLDHAVQGLVQGVQDLGFSGSSSGMAAAAAAAAGSLWWEKDEIDVQLIDKATAEAAAAHWTAWTVHDDDSPYAAAAADDQDVAAATGVLGFSGCDNSRGRWDYTVGLVGKPSAGKSTFYNAVVDPSREEDAAREAPFPFTTITPNIGRGHIVLPDPAPMLGFTADTAQPAHGYALGFDPDQIRSEHSNIGPLRQLIRDCGWQQQQDGSSSSSSNMLWRRVPVVVKDVAGLVPGAYKGRGRGNAFLNDLCDADVLVHVVDASGSTDSEGAAAAPGDGADPRQDILWVRRELHCWVYDNVRAKWPSVIRRPNRLPGLFTGYHASTALVHAVLRAVGLKMEDLNAEAAAAGNAGLQGGTKETNNAGSSSSSSLSSWGEWELHRLVAHFLAARFPILLALNKADLPSAQAHIRAVLAAYPHDAALAVSAATERQLQQLRRAGHVSYLDGSSSTGSSTAAAAAAVIHDITQNVLQPYGSTGVLAALTCAVALKPPRWVFPIADRETCTALAAVSARAGSSSSNNRSGSNNGTGALGWGVDAKARAAQGNATGVLRDCVLLKPGCRVEDVYQVLKRPPYGLLEGEFVRAECRVLDPRFSSSSSKQLLSASLDDQHHLNFDHGNDVAAAAAVGRKVQCRVVRKDELIGPSNCVLLLQTNRKVSWQGSAAAKRHH